MRNLTLKTIFMPIQMCYLSAAAAAASAYMRSYKRQYISTVHSLTELFIFSIHIYSGAMVLHVTFAGLTGRISADIWQHGRVSTTSEAY